MTKPGLFRCLLTVAVGAVMTFLSCQVGERCTKENAVSKQTVRINSDEAKEHFMAGVNHSLHKNYPEAIKAYQEAIRIKPDYLEAHYNLGVTYQAAGQNDLALSEYKVLQSLNANLATDLLKVISQTGRKEQTPKN